jgi:hypothetical protein
LAALDAALHDLKRDLIYDRIRSRKLLVAPVSQKRACHGGQRQTGEGAARILMDPPIPDFRG